jgi:PleD family two-component response regulator
LFAISLLHFALADQLALRNRALYFLPVSGIQTTKKQTMQKKYILLIDDDPDEFEFFLNAIERIPGLFECNYAISAAEAYGMLKELSPDYIFVDMNMPLVNGLECTAKLKSTKGVSDIPVYIYTTGYDSILKNKALQLGASGCIKKHSESGVLVRMLTNLYETGMP